MRAPTPPVSIDADRKASFLKHCDEWLCDGYFCDVRYLAIADGSTRVLFDATVLLTPLPHAVGNSLLVETGSFIAGQDQPAGVTKTQLMGIVERALSGSLTAGAHEMTLPGAGDYRIQSAAMSTDTWFQPLTCQVIGAAPKTIIADRATLDTFLRAAEPPFDGTEDLRSWLGLRLPESGSLSSITISISPPVDVLTDRSGFLGDALRIVLSAHRNADRSLVRLAIRAVPSGDLKARLQIADKISWNEGPAGLIEGTVDVSLADSSAALSMLLVGSETVRRQWFLHPTKSPNYRLAAVKQFDPELRMVRKGLFESDDSRRFETAVAALLFVLGFSSALQLETDAPDIVVVTPAGRIVLVECTIRIADIGAKTGKLVDRRGALQKTLQSGNKAVDVSAALICRLPRDQIAAKSDDVNAMGIFLATAEDLNEGLMRAEVSADADQILTLASARIITRPVGATT